MCITPALAGLLVLTQVHANTPEAAIQRLTDVSLEENSLVFRRRLAEILSGVSAQILLPRADGKGRVAAYGVLIPDDEMRQAIAEARNIFDRKTPLPQGCQSLSEDIENLFRQGIITEKSKNTATAGSAKSL